jgi:hypothetical protein
MEAQVSGELEMQRKGERFSLINPPELPEKPDRPNRLVVLLLGAFLAVVGGLGVGVIADNIDRTVHTAEQLARAMGSIPLGVIPYLPSEDEIAHLGRRRAAVSLAGFSVVVIGAVIFHVTWMPLDVLWFTLMRKLG